MPLPWTLTFLSFRNLIDLRIHYRHCKKSQQDYIPLSQPSISFRNMKRGQFITVPTAPSAAKATQPHYECKALVLCWDSGCMTAHASLYVLKAVCWYSLTRKLIWLWKWIETSLVIGQKQRGVRPSLIAATYNLKYSCRPFHPFPLFYSCCGSCHSTLIFHILIPGTPG